MDHKEINEMYEESVYQIRLRVAINLLSVPGVSHDDALAEADKFVKRLEDEDIDWLKNRFR